MLSLLLVCLPSLKITDRFYALPYLCHFVLFVAAKMSIWTKMDLVQSTLCGRLIDTLGRGARVACTRDKGLAAKHEFGAGALCAPHSYVPACIQKEMLGKIIRTEWCQKVGLINDELLKKRVANKRFTQKMIEKK